MRRTDAKAQRVGEVDRHRRRIEASLAALRAALTTSQPGLHPHLWRLTAPHVSQVGQDGGVRVGGKEGHVRVCVQM